MRTMETQTGVKRGRPKGKVMEGVTESCRAVILCTINTVDEIEAIMAKAYDGVPMRVQVGSGLFKLQPPNWKGVKEI